MDRIQSKINGKAVEHGFQGVVRIEDRGEILFEKAYGLRDISNSLPNLCDTAFGLASGTKSFTAAGIAVLIDRGAIAFDTTVKEIFGREFSFVSPEATVEQLLRHTSGIYDYYDEELITDFDNFRVEIPWNLLETPGDYLPLFEGRPAKFTPGERFSYSNGGYVFLGIIIEEITGKTYRDYMKQAVLEPADMKNSGFFAFNDLPPNTALGYIDDKGRLKSNIYALPIRGGGDGGMYASAADISRFWRAMAEGKIVSEKVLARLISPTFHNGGKRNYGCGFYLSEDEPEKVFFMEGGDGGVGFYSRYDRRRDNMQTVISNRTEGEVPIKDVLKLLESS